jgi:Tol biopolymer transport system component
LTGKADSEEREMTSRPTLFMALLAGILAAAILPGLSQATPAVSNGRIAYMDTDGQARLQVWVVSAHHSGAKQLTHGYADSGWAVWSPKGKRIAYFRGRYNVPKSPAMFLYVAAADGRGARRLASCGLCGVQWLSRPNWSPNGRWIAFSRDTGTHGQESLWVVAAAGGRPRRLTGCRAPCADVEAAWSPDGHLLAFARNTPTPGASGIYTVRANGSGLTRIAAGGHPAWSPSGRRIAFDSDSGIEVANADGSHLRVLFAAETAATGPGVPFWSPDGHDLVFFQTPEDSGHFTAEVWTMHADGSGQKRLYHSGCCVHSWAPPIWSPDGRTIAFSANSAGGTFVIDADGTGLRRLSRITSSTLSWQRLPEGERP